MTSRSLRCCGRWARRLPILGIGIFLAATATTVGTGHADDAPITLPQLPPAGRYTMIEENDFFFYPTDHHYTQGIRFSYLTPPVVEGDATLPAFDWLDDVLFSSEGRRFRHMDWSAGQSIFTPTDLVRFNPDPNDRPYAGWFYAQAGFIQNSVPEEGRGVSRLDDLEVQLGVVGPQAAAEETQNDWHEFLIHQAVSNGWGYQLHDEPGLNVIYQRHWRIDLANTADDGKGFGVDVVPDAGVSLGNILTYANTGATLRLGYKLQSDYGPPRVLPAPSGGDYFDNSVSGLGGYVFVTGEGRAVAHNVFIQGNTFQPSRGVTLIPAVGDFVFGGTLFWGRWLRATVSLDNRSDEFFGQDGPDRFTSFSLSANFDW